MLARKSASQNIHDLETRNLRFAHDVEGFNFQLSQVAAVLEAIDHRLTDHPGPDADTNHQASALVHACALLLNHTRDKMQALSDRMLNAGEV